MRRNEKAVHLVIPGPLDQLTGGYIYDAHIVHGLRAVGWTVTVHSLEGRFPNPDLEAQAAMASTLAALPDDSLVVLDGLAAGGLPHPLLLHGQRLRLMGLVHHPLSHETGVPEDLRERLAASEARGLAACRGVIVTSRFTARQLEAMGTPSSRIRVVEPGTHGVPGPRSPARVQENSIPRLLCVASVVPRKGHDVLLEALALLRDHPWECHCVGSLTRNPSFAARIQRQGGALDFPERVHFHGEVSPQELEAYYKGAHCFVLASHYEGYGMVLTEALAHGLPVVSTTGGAIPDTVPAQAALLVPPGNPAALAEALGRVVAPDTGPELRRRLSDAARRHGELLPTWDAAVSSFQEALLDFGDRSSQEFDQ
ncbi:MAG: glycosyltransferase family 4 protein [Gemmatimonadota bacterium]